LQPNVRYLYSAMPLAMIAFSAVLAWMHANQRWMYRLLMLYLVACAGLNAYFLPSSSYYHKDFCLRLPFSRAEHERYKDEVRPSAKVNDYYNQNHSHSTVLLTGPEAPIAGLEGDFYMNHWHQYSTFEALRGTLNAVDMLRLLEKWGVEYFMGPKPTVQEPIKPAALKAVIEHCTAPEYAVGNYYLAHLVPDCGSGGSLNAAPARLVTAVRGFYDDSDPLLVYRGEWSHDTSFSEPDRHTVSYTDVPGGEIAFAFEGRQFTYEFTKAPNRGIASVTVDGLVKGEVDQYAPRIEWKSTRVFCCFGPGRHEATISVTGRHDSAATARFVDLDGLIVW